MILIDAHIHIHECFNLNLFFDSAKANFLDQIYELKIGPANAVLCLTESHKTHYFEILLQKALLKKKTERWNITCTLNNNVVKLTDQLGFEIFLIAGRQIVTKENLEVLAIGLLEDPEDGSSIDEVLEYVNKNNAIPIIPWGVGKWLGKREKIIKNLIAHNRSFPIYLGDNGNRPLFWKKSNLFNFAANHGIFNLPGSDPLPFRNGEKKPGSFGFLLKNSLDVSKPFDSVYSSINSTKKQFITFGKLEYPLNFLNNQISMQFVKRNRK